MPFQVLSALSRHTGLSGVRVFCNRVHRNANPIQRKYLAAALGQLARHGWLAYRDSCRRCSVLGVCGS